MANLRRFAIAGTLVLFLAAGLGMAGRKAPWTDEGWFGSAAYHLAAHNRLVVPEIEDSPEDPKMMRSNEHIFWNVPLYEVWEGASAKLFGFSLMEARVTSLFWGLVALIVWALIVRRLAGDAAALLTLLLLGIDHTFLFKASDVRMDTMSAALGALAILLYLGFRERNLSQAILASQICVTLSFLTHPNGGIMAFLDTAALAFYYDRARLRIRHALPAALAYLAGALGWGLYLMQDLALARVQFGGTAAGRFSGLLAPVEALRREFLQRYWYAFGGGPDSTGLARLKILILLAYSAGAVGACVIARRIGPLRPLLLVTAIHTGYLTFFDATKQGAYLAHTFPLLVVLFSVWITALWTSHSGWRPVLAAGVAALLLLQLAAVANTIVRNQGQRDYLAATAYIERHAASGDLILGPTELEFAVGFERPLSDDRRLGYDSRKHPKFIVVNGDYRTWFDRFRTERPEVYSHIRSTLDSYRLVFQSGEFNIYERPVS